MKKLTYILFFLFPTLLLGQEVTLDSCYQWTRINYPNLKNKQLNIEASALRIKNLRSNYFPTLDLNGQAHYQSDVPHMEGGIQLPTGNVSFPSPPLEQFKITLDIQQTIYDGGITKQLKKLESQKLESQNQQIEVELFQLNQQVNDLFFTALLLKKQLEQLYVMNQSLQKSLKAVESGVRNGILLPGSDEELQVSIFELEQKSEQTTQTLEATYSILNELTGQEFNASTKLEAPNANANEELKRPELELFAAQKNNLNQLGNISKSKRMPKLGAFAQLGYGNPALNMLKDEWKEFYIVGARLQWNIYDWGNTKRERQEYNIKQSLINNQEESFLKNINIAKTRELMKQKELKVTIEKDSKIIALHESIRKRSESQLANGVITSSEYIKKLTAETQAKINRDMHNIELLRSQVNLNTLYGHTTIK